MTAETRAELRTIIGNLVRRVSQLAAQGTHLPMWSSAGWATGFGGLTLAHFCDPQIRYFDDLPPLTTAQTLALSVLLGERDAATTAAMLDAMIESGYLDAGAAAAIAERARREERAKIADTLEIAIATSAANAREAGFGVDDKVVAAFHWTIDNIRAERPFHPPT